MPDCPSALRSRRLFTLPQRFVYLVAGLVIASGLVIHALVVDSGLVAAAVQGALVLGATLVGPAAMYVHAGQDGVTIRNLLRTHWVPWGDVRGFTLDDRFPYLAYLDVADGREVPLLAIADDPLFTRAAAHDRNIAMIEGLNLMWREEVVRATTGVLPAPVATAAAATTNA
ncbi:MAG TPA: PH domain-containing protein [Acidimicrobiales bacterium]|nr:PH domain-containing protein [Acidimicrobiales bacterium]